MKTLTFGLNKKLFFIKQKGLICRGGALCGLGRAMARPNISNFFFIGMLFSGGFKPPLNRLCNLIAFWFAGVSNPLYLDDPECFNALQKVCI
jgi:hypothetical protein